MIDEYNRAVDAYQAKWRSLVASRKDKSFFETLRPTAVGWKTTDRQEYAQLVAALHDQADLLVEKWMNGRWIAKLHLKDTKLNGGIEIIKVMQRRPGSTDATGLDHLDFYTPVFAQAEGALQAESDLTWSRESNDIIAGYDWLSIWFDNTEAKIKPDTVFDVVTTEMQNINKHIIGKEV